VEQSATGLGCHSSQYSRSDSLQGAVGSPWWCGWCSRCGADYNYYRAGGLIGNYAAVQIRTSGFWDSLNGFLVHLGSLCIHMFCIPQNMYCHIMDYVYRTRSSFEAYFTRDFIVGTPLSRLDGAWPLSYVLPLALNKWRTETSKAITEVFNYSDFIFSFSFGTIFIWCAAFGWSGISYWPVGWRLIF